MSKSNANNGQVGLVAETYARALYAAAKGVELVQVRDEIASLATVLDEMPKLAALFGNRTIDRSRRAKSIKKMFGSQVCETTLNFLYVLNDKGRLSELRNIARAFDQIDKAERGQVDVEVYTAVRLSREQLDQVGERIGAGLGKKAVVTQHIDESLIGGLKVRIGDKLIDASVASQLRRLGRNMIERSRQALRAGQMIEQ
ncbi:MAG: ATP synthase F1 subunit delta [Phycisphaera sp.]|nr:ATP synthase F1 subunit delta [Phycisphaera sp.]